MQASSDTVGGLLPKIGDFGLARRTDFMDKPVYKGAYPYLAPEVLKDGRVSQVGCIPDRMPQCVGRKAVGSKHC